MVPSVRNGGVSGVDVSKNFSGKRSEMAMVHISIHVIVSLNNIWFIKLVTLFSFLRLAYIPWLIIYRGDPDPLLNGMILQVGDFCHAPPSLAETGGKMLPQIGGENDTYGSHTDHEMVYVPFWSTHSHDISI